MPLPGVISLPPAPVAGEGCLVPAEEQSKKVRKPYTISKSRESWTEEEHDKFLEALHLFDRDWKKIEAFVGSKTVIQIRSHAQKYFLKVQKSGSNERVPPPRPKRKAAHPYPQKASKIAPATSESTGQYQSLAAPVFEPGKVYRPDPSSAFTNRSGTKPILSWTYGSAAAVNSSNTRTDDAALAIAVMAPNCCCSSTSERTNPRSTAGTLDQTNQVEHMEVVPDFAQVYSFIGSVFDPNASDHLQRLKRMDPINVETVLLLMRNLSANLVSPEFEEHRKVLSSYDVESGKAKCCVVMPALNNSKIAIPAL